MNVPKPQPLLNYEYESTKAKKRVLVVQAALDLLEAELSSGNQPMYNLSVTGSNPVQQYADCIEKALQVTPDKPAPK